MKTIEQALEIIQNLEFELKTQEVELYNALNYTLCENVYAPINVPFFNKSAMDGFALQKEDLDTCNTFEIIDTVYAGEDKNITLQKGQCVKIMTGSKIPLNCTTVIQKELATEVETSVSFNIPNTPLNDNIALIGEDIKKNDLVFEKGQVLKPICIAILKSLGIKRVNVYKNPKIAIISIGDELIENNNIAIGNIENKPFIFNSNEAFLYTRLLENNFTADTFIIDDNITKLEEVFSKDYDLFITTGAISVGDKDIVRQYMKQKASKIYFDKVNIMPGGPSCLFEQKNKLILALAGSSYANFVTFELLGMNLLSKFTNNNNLKPKLVQRKLKTQWNQKIKKPRFIRAYSDENNCYIKSTNHKASCIYNMHQCNSFIYATPREKIQCENKVNIYLFGGRNYE